MPKHRFIFWQAINSQLLSRDKFEQFHIKLDNVLCPVCEDAPESNAHLFFDCWFSQQVVKMVSDWLGVKVWPNGFHSWKQWLLQIDMEKKHRILVATMAAVIYFIWNNRKTISLTNSRVQLQRLYKRSKNNVL
uniref:Reverse transcriptase zinc-binding domain-containing protein n=1 Tax=Cannabis sativa TaxID=3483 RepID=A0A803QJV6_CANSA